MDKKQIVFYCASHPFEMIYKIARILKKNNYETILITMSERDRFDFDFYSKAFDKIICSNFQFFKPSIKSIFYSLKRVLNLIRFLISIKFLKPYMVIGISGANWQLKFVHKYFFRKFPFIYFPYDIISHLYNCREEALKTTKKFEIEAEKYCFENADGIIHKGAPDELNLINGRIHKDLKIAPLQLSFLPYCSKEFITPINKNKVSDKDKSLHLVYVGGFPNEEAFLKKMNKIFFYFLDRKIHIHAYTKIEHIKKSDEKEYLQDLYSSFHGNEYFHLHPPLGAKELIKEISKYNFGFFISYKRNAFDIESLYGIGNKISSYFEAGIPIIYENSFIFADKLLQFYKAGLSFDENNLRQLFKKINNINYNALVSNIQKARKDFDMEKNFPRLEKFMQDVILSFKK